jgi:hypothetical protein
MLMNIHLILLNESHLADDGVDNPIQQITRTTPRQSKCQRSRWLGMSVVNSYIYEPVIRFLIKLTYTPGTR